MFPTVSVLIFLFVLIVNGASTILRFNIWIAVSWCKTRAKNGERETFLLVYKAIGQNLTTKEIFFVFTSALGIIEIFIIFKQDKNYWINIWFFLIIMRFQNQLLKHLKNVKSLFKINKDVNDVVLASLWLTLSRFHTLLCCVHCWLLTGKTDWLLNNITSRAALLEGKYIMCL